MSAKKSTYVPPLSDFDFLSPSQLRDAIAKRAAAALSREAAQGAEGAGLVHIKTSQTPPVFKASALEPLKIVAVTSCPSGIPKSREHLTPGIFPASCFPSNAAAFEIDRDLMRLKRLKKNVITSARLHSREVSRGTKSLMVTLTYADECEWSPKQIARYLDCIKQWLKRKGHPCRYVWVYELTKRGRPHYHVLFWLPKGLTMPKADKRGWWPWGLTRTEWARNAVGYLAKYASKGKDSDQVIPKGVRLYGVGGLTLHSRRERAWWNLPVGVRRWGFPLSRWRRCPGGGWVSGSGEWRPSLWVVQLIGGRTFVFPRPEPTPEPFDALLQALKPWPLCTLF